MLFYDSREKRGENPQRIQYMLHDEISFLIGKVIYHSMNFVKIAWFSIRAIDSKAKLTYILHLKLCFNRLSHNDTYLCFDIR